MTMPTPDDVHDHLLELIVRTRNDWMFKHMDPPIMVLHITLPLYYLWMQATALKLMKSYAGVTTWDLAGPAGTQGMKFMDTQVVVSGLSPQQAILTLAHVA